MIEGIPTREDLEKKIERLSERLRLCKGFAEPYTSPSEIARLKQCIKKAERRLLRTSKKEE